LNDTYSDRAGTQSKDFSVSAPQIAPPKGGGAVRGIDEKFAANPVTGTGSTSVPITASPGRAGFGPKLSLSYDSGSGNGPFGFGWTLALPVITRKTDKGLPRYLDGEDSDEFLLSGAEDLVPELTETGSKWQRETNERTLAGIGYRVERYRPRVEGLFARIERWTNSADPTDSFWRSISRDNITSWYGRTPECRIADPADPTRIYSWLLCETHDDRGQVATYEYLAEDSGGIALSSANERNRSEISRSAQRYLKRILYGNRTPYFPDLGASSITPLPRDWLFELVLDYGEHDPTHPSPVPTGTWPARADAFSRYRAGFEVRTYRLCQRALMFHHFPELGAEPCLIRSTDFTYDYEANPDDAREPVYSFLSAVTQTGYRRQPDGEYLAKSMPPVEFHYSQPVVQDQVQTLDADSLENLPGGLTSGDSQWIDLDGEGLSGALMEQGGDWLYKPNLGPVIPLEPDTLLHARLGPARRVSREPSVAAPIGRGARFMDLAGDGQLDLVALDGPAPGFYERTADLDWAAHETFQSLPVIDWSDPNLRLIDLTGDGRADILITEQDALCWHLSLGEAGFGPAKRVRKVLDEERGPNLVFADRDQSIHLADLSGDGLSDLVRIRNGEVCYWPNLGYGRFGAKVTMDHAPRFDRPDHFDRRRIRLADIDGSGTTDIIYLADDEVRLYFNQSGNSWSEPQTLPAFPLIDSLASVQVADLFGNGTACLVWSSPLARDSRQPLRYLDLMGGQKPHLLVRTLNNLGAETQVHYAPSTRFYLADKQAGKPWVTRLPFPVHVVERVETLDHLSGNRFVTRYAYHHGYFDGTDREFRGFGMVEQWDTEELAALTENGALDEATNLDSASHVPPVHTKTWFHTGAYLGRGHVSDFFAGLLDARDTGEYYREPGLTDTEARTLLLSDTLLPLDLSLDEEREACRVLKGRMLRQELYALDGTDQAPHPYSVTEQNFAIRCLQPVQDNRHGVFLTHPREALSLHYERNCEPNEERDQADPRITHALTLEVDDFGNVLRSASIGYGRRQPDPALSLDDQQQQGRLLATLSEHDFTNAIELDDAHRTPLPCEARTYEITGLALPVGAQHIPYEDCLAAADAARPLAYEQQATGSAVEKRLIKQLRTLYRPDDLGAAQGDELALLLLGQVEPMALAGESYKLALTPGLVADIFDDRVTDAMLANEGRYVHSEGDDAWWIPSGRSFLSPGSQDGPEAELAHARAHFYLPHRIRDPFHTAQVPTEGRVVYDRYDLLLQETRDSLDNRITVGERDPAGNLTINGNDYRVLQPALVMDPNRNRSAAAFDTLGMLVGAAVMGKPEEELGDTLEGFEPDLSDTDIAVHLAAPLNDPHAILQGATTRLVYDLFAYQRSAAEAHPQPAVVYSLARETHVSDLGPGEATRVQHAFAYSDGFGREIQKKVQAEPGPLTPDGPDTSPRWTGSGWTIFNNKGKPVRQYEPFFSATHGYEPDVQVGVSPILCYDPLGRVVATLHPNRTWQKVRFDAWRQETWDSSDTALIADPAADLDAGTFFARLPQTDYLPTWYAERIDGALGPHEQQAAEKSAVHADTPAVTHLDSLGRSFLSIAHNRLQRPSADPAEPPEEAFYETRIVYDIEGNQRDVIDAKGRVVMHYDVDLLGTQIRTLSMDAGTRWILADIAGQPIRAWDSRGHAFRTDYDPLHRPLNRFVQGNDAAKSDPQVLGHEVLFERIEYGEGQPDDLDLNLRTRAFHGFDGAGVATTDAYDFKGNPLSATRQLAADYKTVPDWAGTVPLEAEVFRTTNAFDALNRQVSQITPDDSEVRRTYNEAGLLETIEANLRGEQRNGAPIWTSFVDDTDYNAKGQRERIRYGNGIETTYDYDPLTFRLIRLKTTRSTDGDLQNLSYTYDAAGNITHIHDGAQQTIFFANARVEPHREYTYDAINQLVAASGREQIGQVGPLGRNDTTPQSLPHPNDGAAMRRYQEQYAFDSVGNIEHIFHHADGSALGAWASSYRYANDSNRLLAINQASEPHSFLSLTYNRHGSISHMPSVDEIYWDFSERMIAARLGGGGHEYCSYDAKGERVRKVWEKSAHLWEERVYIGNFEILRRRRGAKPAALACETLCISEYDQKIALVDVLISDETIVESPSEPFVSYQLRDHLGSISLELDGSGSVVSYEEYTAHGNSSYFAKVGKRKLPKRWRFAGKERDEGTGLYYFGRRYYSSDLARWLSADPEGITDGLNQFAYARNGPINRIDSEGASSRYFQDGVDPDPDTDEPTQIPYWDESTETTKDFGRFRTLLESLTLAPAPVRDVPLPGPNRPPVPGPSPVRTPNLPRTLPPPIPVLTLLLLQGDNPIVVPPLVPHEGVDPDQDLDKSQGVGTQSKQDKEQKEAQAHHIATNKGTTWNELNQIIFEYAGLDINREPNLVLVLDHKGPHPYQYHKIVYDTIFDAVERHEPGSAGYQDALISALHELAVEINTPGTPLYFLVRVPSIEAKTGELDQEFFDTLTWLEDEGYYEYLPEPLLEIIHEEGGLRNP
jgi:RHS repeat-associated protein